jgi:hypothetical protein
VPTTSVSAVIYVPAEVCYMFCREGMSDGRWRAAYRSLRPDREFSAQVVEEDPPVRLKISIAALGRDPGSHNRSLGFQIEYRFTEQGPDTTFVEIDLIYGVRAAMVSAGTMEHQTENDALHRLAALLALEAGYAVGRGERGDITPTPQ